MRYGLAKVFVLLTSFCCIVFIGFYYWMQTSDTEITPAPHGDVYHGGSGSRVGPGKRSKVRKLPGCLLIGVRKGGTRALIDMMSLHKKIKVSHLLQTFCLG